MVELSQDSPERHSQLRKRLRAGGKVLDFGVPDSVPYVDVRTEQGELPQH